MMVQPDAVAACFRIKRTQDVDIHARNLASWEQHYEQTSAGAFRGEVRELFDDGLQVFEEVATCATSHCGAACNSSATRGGRPEVTRVRQVRADLGS